MIFSLFWRFFIIFFLKFTHFNFLNNHSAQGFFLFFISASASLCLMKIKTLRYHRQCVGYTFVNRKHEIQNLFYTWWIKLINKSAYQRFQKHKMIQWIYEINFWVFFYLIFWTNRFIKSSKLNCLKMCFLFYL